MVTSYQRGHLIIHKAGSWVYADDGTPTTEDRPCARCGRMPTPEGYDACLGYMPGSTSACCGHGAEPPFVIKAADVAMNGILKKGEHREND